MKCPKCQYIGFDQSDRCRNCGYDFSLSTDLAELDLPIKTGEEPLGPLADFTLIDQKMSSRDPEPTVHAPSAPARSSELPLFNRNELEDDTPLVSLPASPRAPVSVRKSAVRQPGTRRTAQEPVLDLEPATGIAPASHRSTRPEKVAQPQQSPDDTATAPAGARLLGAAVDLLLLTSIDATVIYLTLRLCDLTFADLRQLPLVPLAAFLALLNGGYMAAFTAAGGQSIGKMAAGTRVIAADSEIASPGVPLGQAVVRAAAYAVSLLPAGLGFLPALFGSDRRALHDRLAQTRVVKA
jgi:uncharacterized RDD family membrane protein YckC